MKVTLSEFKAELIDMSSAITKTLLIDEFVNYYISIYLDLSKLDLIVHNSTFEIELTTVTTQFKEYLNNKPIQYIFGKCHFYNSIFTVNQHVLIPRNETEELVDLIIQENTTTENLKLIDIGTGSGCIAISISKNTIWQVDAIDVSAEAIEVATQNNKTLKENVHFIHDSILKPSHTYKQYDIIVSNPPYITPSEKALMENNVLDHEPHLALFIEENDPLIFYRHILQFAQNNLSDSGKIYVEINQYLYKETLELFRTFGYTNAELVYDINDNPRIIKAQKA